MASGLVLSAALSEGARRVVSLLFWEAPAVFVDGLYIYIYLIFPHRYRCIAICMSEYISICMYMIYVHYWLDVYVLNLQGSGTSDPRNL